MYPPKFSKSNLVELAIPPSRLGVAIAYKREGAVILSGLFDLYPSYVVSNIGVAQQSYGLFTRRFRYSSTHIRMHKSTLYPPKFNPTELARKYRGRTPRICRLFTVHFSLQ
jgi:hypothetical protein